MRHSINFLVIPLLVAISFTASIAQAPLNWTRDEINPGEDFTLFPDVSFYSEGMKSCRMQLNSGAVPYLVSDVFNVTPGTNYEFSFDVFDNDTAGQVKIYADFYDAYGFDIFGQPPVFSSDSAEWQTISWTGTIPSQAVAGYVLIKFYCQPDLYSYTNTSRVWIDNFRFLEEGAENRVTNGGFEDWLVGVDETPGNDDQLAVYPNPARDFATLVLPEKTARILMSDLTGRCYYNNIINDPGNGTYRLDLRNLPQGIYITSVILESGLRINKRIIKY